MISQWLSKPGPRSAPIIIEYANKIIDMYKTQMPIMNNTSHRLHIPAWHQTFIISEGRCFIMHTRTPGHPAHPAHKEHQNSLIHNLFPLPCLDFLAPALQLFVLTINNRVSSLIWFAIITTNNRVINWGRGDRWLVKRDHMTSGLSLVSVLCCNTLMARV